MWMQWWTRRNLRNHFSLWQLNIINYSVNNALLKEKRTIKDNHKGKGVKMGRLFEFNDYKKMKLKWDLDEFKKL